MKTKNLFLTVVLLFTATLNYAQVSYTSAGIAVQGISRDATNRATEDATVNLVFQFYIKLPGNNTEPIGGPISKQVVCDNFGVFSTIIDPSALYNHRFSNNEVWLAITNGGTEISNSKLQHVPYAISANNGVPTGSIMPFAGTTAPQGWALCNGQPLPTEAYELIKMIGANAPNLQGRFLKGAGTDVEDNVVPIAINTPQVQSTRPVNHEHSAGSLNADTNSVLAPREEVAAGLWNDSSNTDPVWTEAATFQDGDNIFPTSTAGMRNPDYTFQPNQTRFRSRDTNHQHNISGSTGNISRPYTEEVRPSSYGVNYIIKL